MTPNSKFEEPEDYSHLFPAPHELADDDDELDSSGIDFKADPVSDDDLPYLVLSPEGDPEKLAEYERLFGKKK